ncbi:MAG: hypothetical protein ACYCSF_10670 [Acidimicrobiales bacterium]
MPAAVSSISARPAALAALAVPILAMIGLFGWAGAQSAPGDSGIVGSFIAAFNNRNCTVMAQELYRAPGAVAPTCSQLVGTGQTKLLSCRLAPESLNPVGTPGKAPAGYSNLTMVRASCDETSSPGPKAKTRPAAFDFYVATNTATGTQQIVSLRSAGP